MPDPRQSKRMQVESPSKVQTSIIQRRFQRKSQELEKNFSGTLILPPQSMTLTIMESNFRFSTSSSMPTSGGNNQQSLHQVFLRPPPSFGKDISPRTDSTDCYSPQLRFAHRCTLASAHARKVNRAFQRILQAALHPSDEKAQSPFLKGKRRNREKYVFLTANREEQQTQYDQAQSTPDKRLCSELPKARRKPPESRHEECGIYQGRTSFFHHGLRKVHSTDNFARQSLTQRI